MKLDQYLTEARRRWLYGIALAAAPLLVAAGALTGPEADMWVNLIAATLLIGSSGLASINVGAEPEHGYQGKHRLED